MIKKIYTGLVWFYNKVKTAFFWTFVFLFMSTFVATTIYDETPRIFSLPWIIVGGSMILFAFVAGFLHILVGMQLKKEDKLDDEGNYRK